METKHTPGEWTVKIDDQGPYFSDIKVFDEDYGTIAHLPGNAQVYHSDRNKKAAEEVFNRELADAKIMAAGPDMLKELIRLNGEKPRHPSHPDSKFTWKADYDKAYKKWSKTNKIILKATQS